jgi:hypothetical protein
VVQNGITSGNDGASGSDGEASLLEPMRIVKIAILEIFNIV